MNSFHINFHIFGMRLKSFWVLMLFFFHLSNINSQVPTPQDCENILPDFLVFEVLSMFHILLIILTGLGIKIFLWVVNIMLSTSLHYWLNFIKILFRVRSLLRNVHIVWHLDVVKLCKILGFDFGITQQQGLLVPLTTILVSYLKKKNDS